MKHEPSFNSKILLFGEYSIIQDSMGLTLPYEEFKGKLTFDVSEMNEQFVTESNDHLAVTPGAPMLSGSDKICVPMRWPRGNRGVFKNERDVAV